MNIVEIRKMSAVERFQTMEAIWDSFLYEDVIIDSPEWHRDILGERKRKIETGKAEFIPITKLKVSLNS